MGLQFKPADEGGDGLAGLWGRGSIRTPAGLQRLGDGADLLGGGGQVSLDRPGIAILGVEGGRFIVAIESCLVVPEKLVGGCLNPGSYLVPCGRCGGVIELLG